jgi:hypothetical protein
LILVVAPQKNLVSNNFKKSRVTINPNRWTSGRDRRNDNIEALCGVVENLGDVEANQT